MYEIVRFSQSEGQEVIEVVETLEQAQEICSDSETSSMTAQKPNGCDSDETQIEQWHREQKHWFYGYRKIEE